jgi:copper chaperone CopZ
MKNLLVLCVLLLSFSASAQSKLKTLVVRTNIYCDHCQVCETCGGKLEKELIFEKGIKRIQLDPANNLITVSYNPSKTNENAIRKAIAALGYDADEIPADVKAQNKLDDCCRKKS